MKLKEKFKVYYFISLSLMAIFIGPSAFGQVTEDDITALQDDIDQNELDSDTADTNLQTNIDNEATARSTADNQLQTNINNEATTRSSADTNLQTNIDNEVTARSSADDQLQTNINAEATTREAMDSAIAVAIGLTESEGESETGSYAYTANASTNYIQSATSVIDATEKLDQALYSESQARISADNALRTSINANQSNIEEKRKGIAMVAAMTHTTLLPGNDKAMDIGVGYFRSESAYSINYAGRLNENVQLNFSAASTSSFKDSAVRCSLGFQW